MHAVAAESPTQKWLRQNTLAYPNSERVFLDVDAVLARFPTIRPKTDVYTYDDGRTQLLLCAHGLLPITYRHVSYNIPVAVWITHQYPRQPPIVYVVPTSDMLVKAGRYLDVSGRCNIPYLQNWERKSEGCNLSSLMEAMQEQFSREPPVYAKPKNAPSAGSSRVQTPSSASPIQQSFAQAPPPRRPNAQDDPPPLPPKPGSSTPRSPLAQPPSPHDRIHFPTGMQSPVPPPRTPLIGQPPYLSPSSYVSSPVHAGPHNRSISVSVGPSQNAPGHNPSGTPPPPAVPPRSYRWSMPPQNLAYPPDPASGAAAPPPPLQHANVRANTIAAPAPYLPQSPPVVYSHFGYQQSPPLPPPPRPPMALPNLLDEESDSADNNASSPSAAASAAPPPPRPMNPELIRLHTEVHAKLTSEFASLQQALALDAERLRAHQRDLLAGEPAIRDEMARLEAVRDVCRNVAERYQTVVDQAERNVSELRRKGDPEVDELICSTTIVHNQLINLVADDNAIEDTIYHLHRGLNTGRIDLERFLRTTRVLAEEQFMKRVLIEKIQVGIPIGQWS